MLFLRDFRLVHRAKTKQIQPIQMLRKPQGRTTVKPIGKRWVLVCIVFLAAFATSFVPNPGPVDIDFGVKTVVIDPGHGGKDTGCLGASAREKDVALAIGLKLGKYIEDNFDDVKVIYTRKTDVFVELHERAAIANRANADLFICVHANSGGSHAHGTETYVMGMHKLDANLKVSQRENASILLEEDHELKYDGFDPSSAESYIIFSLYQSAHVQQSALFAAKIQEEFTKLGRRNRGVKQAGFLVLYKTTMPSVLIETGFLTNAEEEKFLASEENQDKMASCIYRAFESYKAEMESRLIGEPDPPAEQTDKPKTHGRSLYGARDEGKSTETAAPEQENAAATAADATPEQELVYKVQLATSSKKMPLKPKNFNGLESVSMVEQETGNGTIYRYYYGAAGTFAEVQELKKAAREKGYPDAFVKPFYKGEPIGLGKAMELEKQTN